MNLLLLSAEEASASTLHLPGSDRRARHLREVIRPEAGSVLSYGIIDGSIGQAELVECSEHELILRLARADTEPPAALPMTLVLALPRPKMLRRTLQSAVSLGIKRICICHCYKVEKSYWQSPYLAEAAMHANTLLGLEQAMDTTLPQISFHRRFKPFVEDELPTIAASSVALLGSIEGPALAELRPSATQRVTLAVGPEGGFLPYEQEKLVECGFRKVSLGPRVLRVETALPALVGALLL